MIGEVLLPPKLIRELMGFLKRALLEVDRQDDPISEESRNSATTRQATPEDRTAPPPRAQREQPQARRPEPANRRAPRRSARRKGLRDKK
jgi:hypothetical protein